MATTPTESGLTKGARITGAHRQALGAQLAERYQAGESIRTLAQETGRSFGFVHGVIKESGVPLRGRGGATRRTPTVAPEAAAAETTKPKAAKSKKADVKKALAKKDEPKKSAAKKDEVKKEKTTGKKKGRS